MDMCSRGWLVGRASVLVLAAASFVPGCGRSVEHVGGRPAGGTGGTAGSTATGEAGTGGETVDCAGLQAEAERMADSSCERDSDCTRPPHMAGDCIECGLVSNASRVEYSLAAVRKLCVSFYDAGCTLSSHSCPAYQPACVAGACAQ